jgi:hypothetical protein
MSKKTLAAIAKEYARLLSAIAYLHARKGEAGTDIMTPERIIAWAVERGWEDPEKAPAKKPKKEASSRGTRIDGSTRMGE